MTHGKCIANRPMAKSGQFDHIEELGVLPRDKLVRPEAEPFYVYKVVYNPVIAGGGCFREEFGEEITFKDALAELRETEVERFYSGEKPRLAEREKDKVWLAWISFKAMDLAPGDVIRTRFGTKRTITELQFDTSDCGGMVTIERKPCTCEIYWEYIPVSELLTPEFVGQIQSIHRQRVGKARLLEGIGRNSHIPHQLMFS